MKIKIIKLLYEKPTIAKNISIDLNESLVVTYNQLRLLVKGNIVFKENMNYHLTKFGIELAESMKDE